MSYQRPSLILPAFRILDDEARLDFEWRILGLRLAFLLTAVALLLTYGWSVLIPAAHICVAVLLDCALGWWLLRRRPDFVLRWQLGLRLLDILMAYIVLLDVHSFVHNAYYDSVYIFFVVAATATHGRWGTTVTAVVATLAVLIGRFQLIAMGIFPFAPRHISDTFYYALLFVATGLTTGFLMTKSTEKLQYQALHDPLTELPNRSLFQDRLEHGLLLARRNDAGVAVLIFDLDRFKEINDTLGHEYGDRVLQEATARVRTRLRRSDTVARLGGDEFAIVLPLTTVDGARQVALALQDALREPVLLDEQPVHFAASIGIAVYPEHGEDVRSLMRRADVAMYAAKRAGTGCSVYCPDYDRETTGHPPLGAQPRRAIE